MELEGDAGAVDFPRNANLPRLIFHHERNNDQSMFAKKSKKVLSPETSAPVHSIGLNMGVAQNIPLSLTLKVPISVSNRVKVMTPVREQEKFSMPESHNTNNDYFNKARLAIGKYERQLPRSEVDALSFDPFGGLHKRDNDPESLLQDIDEVLKEKFPETDFDSDCSLVPNPEVLDAGEFLAINHKKKVVEEASYVPPVVGKEESCPELGINMRDGGPAPTHNLDHYNIELRTESTPEGSISLSELLQHFETLKKQKYELQTPVSRYKTGKIVFGTESACQSLLNLAEMLPSHTEGVILTESLKPSFDGVYAEGMQFQKKQLVGTGSYGNVQLCEDKVSGKEFVLKQVNRDYKKSEVEILLRLAHGNIAKLFGIINRQGNPEILMENCGRSLLQFALLPDTEKLLTQEKILDFNKQGLQALKYLAIHKILHLDIKPENICIQVSFGNHTVKLTDFGSACSPQDQLTFEGWTAEYMSPEASRLFLATRFPIAQLPPVEGDNSVTSQTDMFSWAMTVLFMYRRVHVLIPLMTNGQLSYKNVDQKEIGKLKLNIILSMARKPDMVKQLLIPDVCTPDMKELLSQMLEGRPDRRITPADALQKIQGMDLQKLQVIEDVLSPLPSDDSVITISTGLSFSKQALPKQTRVLQRRRLSSLSSNGSSSSLLSTGAPASPQSALMYVEAKKTGVVRRRNVKKKLRDRIACPYRAESEIEDITPSTPLDGNVPNFLMMK